MQRLYPQRPYPQRLYLQRLYRHAGGASQSLCPARRRPDGASLPAASLPSCRWGVSIPSSGPQTPRRGVSITPSGPQTTRRGVSTRYLWQVEHNWQPLRMWHQ